MLSDQSFLHNISTLNGCLVFKKTSEHLYNVVKSLQQLKCQNNITAWYGTCNIVNYRNTHRRICNITLVPGITVFQIRLTHIKLDCAKKTPALVLYDM